MCVCYLKETKACVHQIKLEQKTRMFILYKNIQKYKRGEVVKRFKYI